MKRRFWKPLDFSVLFAVLFLSFLLFLFIRPTEKGTAVKVFVGNTLYGQWSFEEIPEEQTVVTEAGTLLLSFEEGEVFVQHADCPEKACVRMGKISRKGESIVCVPLGVCIVVEGGSLDGVTG